MERLLWLSWVDLANIRNLLFLWVLRSRGRGVFCCCFVSLFLLLVLLNKNFLKCVCQYVYVCAHICRCPIRSEEDFESHTSGVPGSCELPSLGAGNQTFSRSSGRAASNSWFTPQPLFEILSQCSLDWSWTYHVAQAGFQFELIFLPQLPELWDYRYIPSCLVSYSPGWLQTYYICVQVWFWSDPPASIS